MIKILLDINVILDVLQKRKNYYDDSARVISLCADSKIQGYISAISFGTLHYILSKILGRDKSLSLLEKIRAITSVAIVDSEVIDLAISSNFSDLEDAIQYYSAARNGINLIITRNKKDYLKAKLPVATPEESLALLQKSNKTFQKSL